jgi:chromosome segregation ATPase
MTAALKHNITAMRETHRLPSFEQVLVTLEEALDEINGLSLRADADEVAWLQEQVAKSRDEIEPLKLALIKATAEVAQLKAKVERQAQAMEGWRGALAYRDAEIERLKAERHTVKQMLQDILDRHGYSQRDAARTKV